MYKRFFPAVAVGFAAIAVAFMSAGCQGQTDKDTIDAAPPTAPNAKAPAPVVGKPGPVGGGDGPSTTGGGASSSESAPAPAAGK
jgi:hypothetical protein